MDDEQRPGSRGDRDDADARSRRDLLKLLVAGAAGGAVVVGLDNVTEDDRSADSEAGDHEGIPTAYDVFVYERDDEYEAINSDGDTVDAGSDGWDVLERGIDTVPEGGSIYVNGRYSGTSTISVEKSIRMFGHEAVVEHREPGDYAFRFEGEERYRTTLAEAAATGDGAVQLDDTSGMEKGHMVLLEAEDGEAVLGRDQPPGEPHSVSEVDGNAVRLEDSIVWRGGYPAGTLVYVVAPIQVHVSGFSVTAPAKNGNFYGVTARNCRDSTFENLWLDKFGSRGIMLEACANFRVRDCTVLQSSDIEAGDGYGIQVWAGCHDVLVEGCVAKECRHPLSVTPGGHREVASRTITFRDCYVTADGSAALNCHGGAAHDVRFEGCMIHTWGDPGVRTGAQETKISGCEFRMNGHNAIDTRNDGQEMIITVTDTDVFGAGSAVHLDDEPEYAFDPLWKLVHLQGLRAHGCTRFFELEGGDIDRVRELTIRGCYWDEVEEEGLRIANRIDGGVIEGNDFGDALADLHIRAREESTTAVTDLHVVGNRFRQPSGTQMFIYLSNSEQCVVSDNKFESNAAVNIYVDGVDSTGNAVKQNTYFAPSPSADPFDVDQGSIARDNEVYDTETGTWL